MKVIKCAICGNEIASTWFTTPLPVEWYCDCCAVQIVGTSESIKYLPACDLRSVLESVDGEPFEVTSAVGEVSDGYHTFNELYEHRHALFGMVVKRMKGWKSRSHADGTSYPGWFIAGITTKEGQVSYHLPVRLWDEFPGTERERAPEWDGHTSDDVVERLKNMW